MTLKWEYLQKSVCHLFDFQSPLAYYFDCLFVQVFLLVLGNTTYIRVDDTSVLRIFFPENICVLLFFRKNKHLILIFLTFQFHPYKAQPFDWTLQTLNISLITRHLIGLKSVLLLFYFF